jgi:hypothetical protein
VAVVIRNRTAKTTAEAFLDNYVVYCGLSKKMQSDQRDSIEPSRKFKELCNITGTEKSRTTQFSSIASFI